MPKIYMTTLAVLLALAALPAVAESGATPIPFTDPYVTPQIIPAPGHYVVTRNLLPVLPPTPIIVIDCNLFDPVPAPAVTIDLNGFVLDNTASPNIPNILILGSPRCEVIIRNGEIIGGNHGIEVEVGFPLRKVLVEDVEIKDTVFHGMLLRDVENFVIRRCTIFETGGVGIYLTGPLDFNKSGVVEDNLITRTADGIYGEFLRSVEISNNRIEVTSSGQIGAGIQLVESRACLIAQNTLDDIGFQGGLGVGIELRGTSGCKLYNNLVNRTASEGIRIDAASEVNLILDNVVRFATSDGLRVDGAINRIQGNVLNLNGIGGAGHGLHLGPPSGGNQYGGNTAEANIGGPCLGLPWSADFCDDTAVAFPNPPGPGPNFSFVNSLMPGAAGPV